MINLTLLYDYLWHWFFDEEHEAGEVLELSKYLLRKPVHDKALQGNPFTATEAEDLAHDFVVEMEAWKKANRKDFDEKRTNGLLRPRDLFDEWNLKYLTWLLERRRQKAKLAAETCLHAEFTRKDLRGRLNPAIGRLGGEEYEREVTDRDLDGELPDEPDLRPEDDHEDDWLITEGTWEAHLLRRLFEDVKAGRLPPSRALSVYAQATHPEERRARVLQSLLRAHEGKGLDGKIVAHFGIKGAQVTRVKKCWKQMNVVEQSGAHNSGRYVYYFCRRSASKSKTNSYPACENKKFYGERLIKNAIEEALSELYIDDATAEKIKARLRETATENDINEELVARRLAAEETRRTNNLKVLYQDRLDGVITADHYKEKAAEIEAALDAVRAERESLRQVNARFREEGSSIVDLVRGLKKQYMKADDKGKAAILGIVLDKVVLRPNDYYVTFREPFGMFFSMNRVKKELEKGE